LHEKRGTSQLSEEKLFTYRSIDSIINELGQIPRSEHPRPDSYRSNWSNLNGIWEFAFDPDDKGTREAWQIGRGLSSQIIVPFCPESQLSGVYDEDYHNVCWYARTFDLPENLRDCRVLLHFGAVDYRTDVWLNGDFLGRHVGGYDSFSFDITQALKQTGNRLVLKVEDDSKETKPSGKQAPERYPTGCHYMRVTGIWQTVWLEHVGNTYIPNWTLTGDPVTGDVRIRASVDGNAAGLRLAATAYFDGNEVAGQSTPVAGDTAEITFTVPDPKPWSPESPALYDLDLKLIDSTGAEIDSVRTYFGLRRVTIEDGMVYLNNKPFFIISALDQGYYPQSLYTPPTDDALRKDVEWSRRYGLNNVRKHQIIAEPRFHYWCDKLGLTIWEEMPDWRSDIDDELTRQWSECVKRDINHPCIITWVPTNERRSLDPNVHQAQVDLYKFTKELDPTLPVIDTSGYFHTETDITDLHVNPSDGEDCRRWWRDWRESIAKTGNFPAWPDRPAFAEGFRHKGQPVIISETGNWRIETLPPIGSWQAYGAGPIANVDEYLKLYRDFFLALMAEPECAGFSYVQLYDVEGEVNGYLTYDRKPKVSPEIIAAIHKEGLELRPDGKK